MSGVLICLVLNHHCFITAPSTHHHCTITEAPAAVAAPAPVEACAAGTITAPSLLHHHCTIAVGAPAKAKLSSKAPSLHHHCTITEGATET